VLNDEGKYIPGLVDALAHAKPALHSDLYLYKYGLKSEFLLGFRHVQPLEIYV
jgi:hypothetical protein